MLCVALLSIKKNHKKIEIHELEVIIPTPFYPSLPTVPEDTVVEKPTTAPPEDLHLVQNKPTLLLRPIDVRLYPDKPDIQTAAPEALLPELKTTIEHIQSILAASDLDTAPSLLPPYPAFDYPPELIREGIQKGQVILIIIIHESGDTEIESIESATHPELIRIALHIANRARFTPPRYNGEAVKARYRWPINLSAPE